ncbi:MAG: LemA family protein [Clostridiales bacterium]|nr:LemA family protein [Candidatus Equinaster intestinalis]
MKNKKLIIIGAIILAVIIIIAVIAGGYNGLVEKEETVNEKYAEIQTQLQRRADLIPNFVATVKGYSDYEKETYTAVTEARSAVAKASNATELADANEKLNGAISVWVNAVTEAYPELKANQNYVALQDELAGTENRIAKSRDDYNEFTADYNITIRKFPKSILAGIFGFDKKDLFKASEGAENVPQVSFN